MAGKKISRNDPCPCGSGKKFKHCCWSKGIDWEARRKPQLLRPVPRPRAEPPEGIAFPGLYGIIDARLKEIATSSPEPAAWKERAGLLAETTSPEERMRTYQAIREARVLPDEAADFLFGHAIQWMPFQTSSKASGPADDQDDNAVYRHTLAMLRRFGLDELADQLVRDRLEYDRRHERGRQFFFGPPDERLAQRLREMGIIN